MSNNFGKTSKLMLLAGVKNNLTVLEDAYYSAPFKIMHPFYENGDFMTVMCLSASAGIMAGDEQNFEITVKEGAKLEFVSQSYEKIHKMDGGPAKRYANLHVEKDAFLYYNPLPTIPFKDSAFTSDLKVHLEDASSKFILKEILSAGRYARGELFEYRYYHNHIQIEESGELIYLDNTRLEPDSMPLNSIGLYEGYTHLGTLILCHIAKDSSWIQAVRTLIDEAPDIEGGITQINSTSSVIRILGRQAEKVDALLSQCLMM